MTPRASSAACDDPDPSLRVIHIDRKTLFSRAIAMQRRTTSAHEKSSWLPSWLFGRTSSPQLDAMEPRSPFASNSVTSAKYSVWNFVPRVLGAQLQRPSNVYFLVIAVLQTIREVSNTRGIPTILLPLAVVLVCSAIKEALEDRERHRADRVANSRPVLTLTPSGRWEQRRWGELRVGNIVKVMKDQTIPADLFLLSAEAVKHDGDSSNRRQPVQILETSNPKDVGHRTDSEKRETFAHDASERLAAAKNDEIKASELALLAEETSTTNLAYIETKSLDGETNLKIRTAIPLVASLCRQLSSSNHMNSGGGHNKLCGTMTCKQPNNQSTSFEGTFSAVLSPAQAHALDVTESDPENAARSSRPVARRSATDLLHTKTNDDGSICVRMSVTAKQMMLRSCVLRNTGSVTGLVVFTGHETNVFCSNTEPLVKTSSVEGRLNRLIVGIVFIQQLVCFLGALLGARWTHTKGDAPWYLFSATARRHDGLNRAPPPDVLAELAKLHLRYFIIMQNFVPISLNVSLEFVKYLQAYFIEQDLEMYDKSSNTPAIVRSSALNEDLGRVHHVFTDKTGTLTKNLMIFRYCMVGGKHYGGRLDDKGMEADTSSETMPTRSGASKHGPRYVDFDPTELFADIQAGGEQAETLRHFLQHMALCHTLIPTKPLAEMYNTPYPEYSASSPDEQALVSAAAFCNVRFVDRTPDALMLLEPGSTAPRRYNILNVLEFDSDRKRMTVIVETPDGTIELLCKGADNVIFERLAVDCATLRGHTAHEQAVDQLTLYAKSGMRTLCLAYKTITRREHDDWNARFTQASTSIEELAKRRQGRSNAIDHLINEMERDFVLLGITAIQDKLQAGVPTTLRLLQEANIKIWTLTGDKMETAVNIGYASALLSHDTVVHQIGGDDPASTASALQELAQRADLSPSSRHQSPFMASMYDTRPRVDQAIHTRCHAHDGPRQTTNQASGFWGNARILLAKFPFSAPMDKTMKHQRKRNGTRGMSTTYSALGGRSMYSAAATDAETPDMSTLDEQSLYDVGIEADNGTTRTPEYGSLAASLRGGKGHQNELDSSKLALVIDGQALDFALRPRLRSLFYKVTRQCASAVICCRVSPKQKAEIVRFVREFEPESVTLAIGDGANDVAMIQEAHIGVGISGQEGAQAVNASDYALAQFRFLQRLLFVHGRWAYRRVAKLMSYMLYKNVTYVLSAFWFGCFCGFSGQPLILDVAAQSFNVLYTSVPLVLFAVFDQDVSSVSASKFPYLYALGQKNMLLARRVFWPWIFNGVWHSIVIFFVSVWAFAGFGPNTGDFSTIASETGKDSGLVTMGFVVFTNLVVVVNAKLCLETFMLTWQFLCAVIASILLWFGVGFVISLPNAGFPQATGEMEYLQKTPTFWLVCLLVLSLSLLRDGLWKLVRRFFLPSMHHILQEREFMGLPNSPRSMLLELRRSKSDAAWCDVPRVERLDENFMRSSPLGERLIASSLSEPSSDDDTIGSDHAAGLLQVREKKKRNLRIRGTLCATGSDECLDAGVEPSFLESSGCAAASIEANAAAGSRPCFSAGRKCSYHGYAFSELENLNGSVASASSTSDVDYAKSFGAHASIKKVFKSVRGRKNA
ncbi:unnamed protein product [Hyaloperonospora brassicae]|uniref:Phospholipid-transporting ATPase n=1 Tax=Hyaloperonospora brassicae TaxID=162125 RepID=A0AAV0UVG3_HYABA|nr:unnamed protein product [Hyaloperonospora brassicae]